MLVYIHKIWENRIWSISWDPSLDYFVVTGESGDVEIYSFSKKGESIIRKAKFGSDIHNRTIRDAKWSPSGDMLALASFDSKISIWSHDSDTKEWECLEEIEGHENEVKCIAWRPNGDILASCSRDKSIWLHEVPEDSTQTFTCQSVLSGHTQDVKRVAWHPDGSLLASASYDDSVKLWEASIDNEDWLLKSTLKGHKSTVWDCAFSCDGLFLASVSDDRSIRVWSKKETVSKEPITALNKQLKHWYISPIFNPNSSTISSTLLKATAASCDWVPYVIKFEAHERSLYGCCWSPCNNYIATCGGDDTLRIWRFQNNELKETQLHCIHEEAFSAEINKITWTKKNDDSESLIAGVCDDGKLFFISFNDSELEDMS